MPVSDDADADGFDKRRFVPVSDDEEYGDGDER